MVSRQLFSKTPALLTSAYLVYIAAGGLWCLSNPVACAAPSAEQQAAADDDDDDVEPIGSVKFRIAFKKEINSDTAYEGQKVEALLSQDLKYQDQLIAPAGSRVYGHVEALVRGRSAVKSVVTAQDPLHRHAMLALKFDRIVTPKKQELNMDGHPTEQISVFSNGETIREVDCGPSGELLKTADTEMVQSSDFGYCLPKSWLTLKGRQEIDVHAGDQIVVQSTVPAATAVSAKVMPAH